MIQLAILCTVAVAKQGTGNILTLSKIIWPFEQRHSGGGNILFCVVQELSVVVFLFTADLGLTSWSHDRKLKVLYSEDLQRRIYFWLTKVTHRITERIVELSFFHNTFNPAKCRRYWNRVDCRCSWLWPTNSHEHRSHENLD